MGGDEQGLGAGVAYALRPSSSSETCLLFANNIINCTAASTASTHTLGTSTEHTPRQSNRLVITFIIATQIANTSTLLIVHMHLRLPA
jgi:hypothetical protein